MSGDREWYYGHGQSWYTGRDRRYLQENCNDRREETDRFVGNRRHRQNQTDSDGYINGGYEDSFCDDKYERNSKNFDRDLHYSRAITGNGETDHTDVHYKPISRRSNEFDMEDWRATSTDRFSHWSSAPIETRDLTSQVGNYGYNDNRPPGRDSHKTESKTETGHGCRQRNGDDGYTGGRYNRDQFGMRQKVDKPTIEKQDHGPERDEEPADYSDSDDEDTKKASGFEKHIVYPDDNGRQQFEADFDDFKFPWHDTNFGHGFSRDSQSDLSNTDSMYLGQGHNVRRKSSRRFRKLNKLRQSTVPLQNQRISFADGMKTLVRRRQTLRLKSKYNSFHDVGESTRHVIDVDRSDDGIYEDVNNVMADEQLPSTKLTKTKTLKQRLQVLQRSGAQVSTTEMATLLRLVLSFAIVFVET